MKFALILSMVFLVITFQLRPQLTGTTWQHSEELHFSSSDSPLIITTKVHFETDNILMTIHTNNKAEEHRFSLKQYEELDQRFKVPIGNRKSKGYLYGYLDQEQQQLYLMPSSISIDLQEINKDQPLEDSKWMVMDKIH